MISEALASLEKAASDGLSKIMEKSDVESDSDLDNIRHHQQFQQIFDQLTTAKVMQK